MVRIQIQVDRAQHREVKRRARRLGISVSEVIRRCLDAQLRAEDAETPDARVRRALAVAGKYADPTGSTRVAAEHDAALAGIYKP